MQTYRLEQILSSINSKYNEVQKNISELKSSIRNLKKLLEALYRLPKELRPPIKSSIFEPIKEILENKTYISNINETINVLNKIYNDVAKTAISYLFLPKAQQCKEDLTHYHKNIINIINTAIKNNRRISPILRDVLNNVMGDPCAIFHHSSMAGLYDIDENINKVLENTRSFFDCKNEDELLNMIKEYLLSLKLHEIIGGSVRSLEDTYNVLTELIESYNEHTDILSVIDNIIDGKYSFKTPLTQILHENISTMLNDVKEKISNYRDVICNTKLKLSEFNEQLEKYHRTVNYHSIEIKNRLTSYIKNIKKFLERIGGRDIVEELEQLSPSIMELEEFYNVLTKVDQVVSSGLEKLGLTEIEKEVLEKLLRLLSKKPNIQLDQVVRDIGEEEAKLKALINVCRLGIIKCVIGV